MAGALETQCAQSFGTEQFHKLGNYVFCAILFLILSSAPISILWIFMDKLLVLLGQDHAISLVAGNYCIWLIPTLFGYSRFGSLFSDSELDLSNACNLSCCFSFAYTYLLGTSVWTGTWTKWSGLIHWNFVLAQCHVTYSLHSIIRHVRKLR